MNPIVTVEVTQEQAPEPNQLQKRGAIISQGGTILASQQYALITTPSDLTALQPPALNLTSVAWSSSYGGLATATAAAAHGIPVNEQFITTIADVQPAGYNGTVLATATGSSTFTYALPLNPGSQTVAGTYTQRNVGEVQAAVNTFFAQGSQQSCYVLELGAGSVSAGVTALSSFITTSDDQFFYSYLVPHNWDGVSSYLAFIAGYENTTSKTYFYTTTTLPTYKLYDKTMKSIVALVEAPVYRRWAQDTIASATWSGGLVTATMSSPHGVYPGDLIQIVGGPPTYNGYFRALPGTTGSTLVYGVAADPGVYTSGGTLVASNFVSAGPPATEFTHAADWRRSLNYNPSTSNRVPPFEFGPMYGVTPFPTRGNKSMIAALDAANISYIGTGAEGGSSGTININGEMLDGRPVNYWYSVDWVQINVDLVISATVINGSATTVNPLYYNQDGIDRLQRAAASVGAQAIEYGLAIGQVVQLEYTQTQLLESLDDQEFAGNLIVNAVPFTNYLSLNPTHYRLGQYNGLTMIYTPTRGFRSIVFNVLVTDFGAATA